MFDIAQALANLPEQPGVYIMKNKDNHIIYIGKAKVLKNRVKQYFGSQKNHPPKVRMMVKQIVSFEFILTGSELEALVLECNMIKKHKPHYNILLKDDKHYPFIKVTMQEQYPRVLLTRRIEKDGAKYFGPFYSAMTVRDSIQLIQDVFKIRKCKKEFPRDIGKERPCLNFFIHKCVAPCRGEVEVAQYRKIFDEICQFLSGNEETLIKTLSAEMQTASEKMDFEKAAVMRDKINSIKKVLEKQRIISTSMGDHDVIAYESGEGEACVQAFFVRNGRLIGREHFMLQDVGESDGAEILSSFVKQFYFHAQVVPKEIILSQALNETDILTQWLSEKRGSKVHLTVPQKGEKKEILALVQKNATEALQQHQLKEKQDQKFVIQSLTDLKLALMLEHLPKRIEAYDISNIGGTNSVGAMVVFQEARPAPRFYRKFKIKWVEGADDYQSMQEVVYRRLMRAKQEQEAIDNGTMTHEQAKFLPLPDLMLIDGGKGHVSAVREVTEVHAPTVQVFGMVKDSKHRTRDLASLFAEIGFSQYTTGFKLITQIQDEVHRVAIAYHTHLRGKGITQSVLDEIGGIGEVRKKALLRAFASIDDLKIASIDELTAVQGMNSQAATAVYDFFHKNP
ncbi:MAG: excinuclease ABC subunit UvrC [Hyphomonadaceae bacterium]|nr:excinuclease ABC subunit UvrC [Clostridia bacterium]